MQPTGIHWLSIHSFIHSYSFNKKFDMSQTMTIKDTQNINTIVEERTIVNERYRLKGIGLIGILHMYVERRLYIPIGGPLLP